NVIPHHRALSHFKKKESIIAFRMFCKLHLLIISCIRGIITIKKIIEHRSNSYYAVYSLNDKCGKLPSLPIRVLDRTGASTFSAQEARDRCCMTLLQQESNNHLASTVGVQEEKKALGNPHEVWACLDSPDSNNNQDDDELMTDYFDDNPIYDYVAYLLQVFQMGESTI
ncbi:hypothetical protein ACJX0J_035952, partial [Zea mays]